ncbi:MAG: hypothetical protein AB7G37_17445 [Solirubrobacteraceae bacterium]
MPAVTARMRSPRVLLVLLVALVVAVPAVVPGPARAVIPAFATGDAAFRTGASTLARTSAEAAGDVRALVEAADALTDDTSEDAGRWAAVLRDLDRAVAATDDGRRALRSTLAAAPDLLRAADRLTLRLDRALPRLRTTARAGAPVVRELAVTARAAGPWVAELRRAVADDGVPTWTGALRGALPALTGLTDRAGSVARPAGRIGRCVDRVLVPAARQTVEDGAFTTDRPLYRNLGYAIVGAAGALQNGDGDGPWGRLDLGIGRDALDYAGVGAGPLVGAVDRAPVGIRPAPQSRRPAYRDDVHCADQRVPDPDRARSAPGDAEAVVGRAQSDAARDRAAGDGEADARGLAAGADEALRRVLGRLDPLGADTDGEDGR